MSQHKHNKNITKCIMNINKDHGNIQNNDKLQEEIWKNLRKSRKLS